MAPYSDHPLGYVELYEVGGLRYLRVPFNVQVYDLPPRRYLDDEWIVLGTAEAQGHTLSRCPPTFKQRYSKPQMVMGTVDIQPSTVHIALMFPSSNTKSGKDEPYRFNGNWKLAWPGALIPAPSIANEDACERRAL